MTALPSTPTGQMHKHACSLCARRKVKCDKGDPCSNCFKAQSQCLYEAPAPHRPRRRAADEDLLARLAQYEDLMRKHNVDFSRYANAWVPSGLELKMSQSDSQSPASVMPAVSRPNLNNYPVRDTTADVERCLWSNLSPELKYPSIQSLARKDDPLSHPTPSLQSLFHSKQPELHELHPEPRSIFRLWQSFVENVNPFTKIVHVPTLQQRILDASWDPSKTSKSLTALLFAIYTVAVGPMPSDDCQASFGESRDTLLARYRTAAVRALIAADFLTTRDLEVMQAFVLYLLADPGSDLTSTLAGAAIRLCQKMGMDRENTDPKMSFFEKEMRIRLWWQLRGLDYRSRAACTLGTKPPPLLGFGHVRLPLNVNDADLHPDMAESPIEHNGPTEMLCVLLKLEVFNNLRSSPTAAKAYDNIIRGSMRDKMSMELENEAVNELEARYEEKFFCKWDKNIPLHALTRAIANLAIARMRFKVHHPRRRADISGADVYMTREESDVLFDSALTALEMVHVGTRTKFSSYIFSHMTFAFQIDAYIYILSDLRRRCSGDRVALAWKLVGILYNDHPELIDDTDNAFYSALGDLTVEAWETRRKELIRGQGSRESDITPQFIRLLWDKRESGNDQRIQMSTIPEPYNLDGLRLMDDNVLDWECWGDFLTL